MDAERGLTLGFRSDSTLFVHLFVMSLVIGGGLVLGLALTQWIMLTLTLTVLLTAEMFQQALKNLLHDPNEDTTEPVRHALRMGNAAVMLAALGAVVTLALLLAQRWLETFGE